MIRPLHPTLRSPEPEASASTNSAIWAWRGNTEIDKVNFDWKSCKRYFLLYVPTYIKICIITLWREIDFKGDSLDRIRRFPDDAKSEAGYQLDKVQRGEDPFDWKPMPSVGVGVKEIRIHAADGAYRVIYVARFANYIYVLNAFEKKQQKTPQGEINLAKKHYKRY